MPNCDFYAVGTDHRSVLEFVLSQGDCDIYESYSRPDRTLRQFHSLKDFEEHFAITNWNVGTSESMLLQLNPHGAKGRFIIQKIELDSKRCQGATFRYAAAGWGLIQLYLEPCRKARLHDSHTNHNSPKRAAAWAPTYNELGDPAEWDWRCVASSSRKLNRFIRSMAVTKIYSRVILPSAAELQNQGIQFI